MTPSKSKPKQNPISQGELESAIQKFRKGGGIIQKLPDQKTLPPRAVGVRWGEAEAGADTPL